MAGAEKNDSLMASGTAQTVTHMRSQADRTGPQWATGLKRLYDQVVDEPIPDSFMDLLSKLDDSGK